jgi:hypothetical protein
MNKAGHSLVARWVPSQENLAEPLSWSTHPLMVNQGIKAGALEGQLSRKLGGNLTPKHTLIGYSYYGNMLLSLHIMLSCWTLPPTNKTIKTLHGHVRQH